MGNLSNEYFIQAQSGNKAAQEFAYKYYRKIIFDCLSQCSGILLKRVEFQTYEDAASDALLRAIMTFDVEKGFMFSSYAYPIIKNAIKVVNRGRNMETGLYQESVGKAKVVSLDGSAMLKVSFFGPFYSGYNVLAIDDEYKYALVAGSNYKYLWMLSREKSMPNYIQDKYMEVAEKAGFDTYKLIWINQD